jgi:Na+-transporting methylmalonyl-CoA/oxaloacetate decarboxylase gamma subunit
MERQRKRGGTNWLGLVIFLVIAFGSPVASFISGLIFQTTGVTVGSSGLAIGMVSLIVLAVAISTISAAVRGAARVNTGSETRVPSTPTPPPQMGAPTQLPSSPRFEPVINPRILIFGVVGLILFGGIFLVILAMSGAI